jgi:hypothetical protein
LGVRRRSAVEKKNSSKPVKKAAKRIAIRFRRFFHRL